MAKSVTSLAVGAGAATAYLRPDLVAGAARDMAFGSFPSFSTASGSNAAFAETEALKAMVEQLSRDLKSHQQRVMVVQTGNERGAGLTTYAVGIVGLGTVLYLTVVRGWRLGDFLYVTRRGLQQGLGQLHTRLEGLNARLNDVKARLQAKLNELGGKQDATIAAQREMSQRLDEVGRDVTNTGSQVRQIHGKVYDMDSALVEVGANQRHANHGIFILCKAVGELMQGSNIASRAELLEFTQHPIWQGDRLQGLESVLGDMDANSKGKRPFLLGGPDWQDVVGLQGHLMSSGVGFESMVDSVFLDVIRVVPQLLLVVLVVIVAVLIGKDILNGMRRPFLKPDQWQALPLTEVKKTTHNTRLFRFALPHADQQLGLPAGQHITLKVTGPHGDEILRPYTPVSDISQRGTVDFLIKVYPEGRMSQALDALAVGDKVLFKGPKGRFVYKPDTWNAIGMLAGGTGITPMYQLLQKILKDPNDTTEISLIFGNVTEDDILLQKELEEMASKHKRFKVFHVLNNPPAEWTGGVGFISESMIREHFPAPAADVLILRCGPLPMMKAMETHLDRLGYTREVQFQF